jgi:hypothetical protein
VPDFSSFYAFLLLILPHPASHPGDISLGEAKDISGFAIIALKGYPAGSIPALILFVAYGTVIGSYLTVRTVKFFKIFFSL